MKFRENLDLIVFYAIWIVLLVGLVVLAQCALNVGRWELVAIDGSYSFELLELNALELAVAMIILLLADIDHIGSTAVDWDKWLFNYRVPITIYAVALSLLTWSLGWMAYIARVGPTAAIPGYGMCDLVGPRVFWFVLLLAAFALCGVGNSIVRDIKRGDSWSFVRLMYGPKN